MITSGRQGKGFGSMFGQLPQPIHKKREDANKQAAATDVALLLEMGFADAVARAALLTAGSVHGALNRLLA